MDTLYLKSCAKHYIEKYDKNCNLIRTAERFNSGAWVVRCYKGKNISGEYNNEIFIKIY